MRNLILIFSVLVSSNLFAQKQDNIWLFGFRGIVDIQDSTWGSTNIDFNFDPPKIRFDSSRIWDFGGTNASICDNEGKVKIYTNGQAVYARDNSVIEDTINYNKQWENWRYTFEGVSYNSGLPSFQGSLILPLPDSEDQFYIFNSVYDRDIDYSNIFQYSTVIFDEQGQGKVDERDHIILQDTIHTGGVHSVRHGNGRDWWVIFSGHPNNIIHKYLFTPDGISLIGTDTIGTPFNSILSQMAFSSSGDKIAYSSTCCFGEDKLKIFIADFNRNTGAINNHVEDFLHSRSFSPGICFSPNSRFLYSTDINILYQYDLNSIDILGSKMAVAEYDGFEYFFTEDTTPGTGTKPRFGWMGLAPDGKIYISATSGSSRVMHRINSPNLKGEACDMEQHSVYLPAAYARTMPNYPNYRLGPLDDRPADTLGLNNHPVAKYRYVQDTLEDLRVHFFDLSYYDPQDYEWEFGDGNTSDVLEPNHTYAEKGVYEVCLTVSNIYDTSTSCKTIMLGTSSIKEQELEVDISIYPNPTSDYLTINFHNYLAMDSEVRFYDVNGQEVLITNLKRASTIVNLGALSSGAYIYKVYDEEAEIYEGQVIVVH